jgi:hypothetical protein
VKVFYRRNDSQLVGDFSVAEGPAITPDKAFSRTTCASS